jgi:hypothetical protein
VISWDDYFNRIIGLRLQFDLARKAIASFSTTREALEAYATSDLEDFRPSIAEASQNSGTDPTTWAYKDSWIQQFLESSKQDAVNRLGDVLHRLRQNEYVLQVAVFETFIRELHRATLRADPSLLRPDRKIDLGKLIARENETPMSFLIP